ncbi:uncharacterized protein [Nicotiana tomentosiformis]|uniref:uncharacterized protein n=1 Tax=Nicotiana tomentosiformis TaxID=4098 RepID=UPI00388CC2A2
MLKKATATQKSKFVADETTSRAPRVIKSRGESHSEIPSRTSHTPPSPEELQGAPALAPVLARRQEVGIGHADWAISARVPDFINLDLPVFTGADPNEDPQVFIDRMQRTLGVMKASATESVELASYRLQDVAVNWYDSWELSRGILSVSSYDVYAFINPGSTLSYITPLVASKFGIKPELVKPFEVSTPVGNPVIAKRVYKDCIVVVHSRSTVADQIELDMVEFDVIMGMDLLASCYANIDFRSNMVRFQFPWEPILEWKSNTASPRGRFISYLKARKMIIKGYIYHLVWVQDVEVESPTIQYIPVVNEFLDVFPNELSGLPPKREIEFAIDLLPDMQPIYIPPYKMAAAELRELKEQLRDLLEKGEGIQVDTQNIEAVKTWPRHTTPTEVHSFLDFGWLLQEICRGIFFSFSTIDKDTTTSFLVTGVKEHQYEDLVLAYYSDTTPQKKKTPFDITEDGVLRYRGRLCVPNVAGLRRQVMGETHYSRYSIHPGVRKMHHDIREIYWLDGMKKDIAEFVAQCPNCQQVKIKNQKPGGLLQAIEIPTWKWETDTQAERTIQTLEDMLRACVIDFKGSWDDHLPLIEFTYNNRYHSSIQMAPYEALYGRKGRSPIGWFNVGETKLVGPELVLSKCHVSEGLSGESAQRNT